MRQRWRWPTRAGAPPPRTSPRDRRGSHGSSALQTRGSPCANKPGPCPGGNSLLASRTPAQGTSLARRPGAPAPYPSPRNHKSPRRLRRACPGPPGTWVVAPHPQIPQHAFSAASTHWARPGASAVSRAAALRVHEGGSVRALQSRRSRGLRATSGDERDGCARRPGLRLERLTARGERSGVQATATPSGRAAWGRRRPAPATPRPQCPAPGALPSQRGAQRQRRLRPSPPRFRTADPALRTSQPGPGGR